MDRKLVPRPARALAVVRDEMKFLNEDDRSWILSKTVEQVWPFS